jgi:hypothetical protein
MESNTMKSPGAVVSGNRNGRLQRMFAAILQDQSRQRTTTAAKGETAVRGTRDNFSLIAMLRIPAHEFPRP